MLQPLVCSSRTVRLLSHIHLVPMHVIRRGHDGAVRWLAYVVRRHLHKRVNHSESALLSSQIVTDRRVNATTCQESRWNSPFPQEIFAHFVETVLRREVAPGALREVALRGDRVASTQSRHGRAAFLLLVEIAAIISPFRDTINESL